MLIFVENLRGVFRIIFAMTNSAPRIYKVLLTAMGNILCQILW